MRTTRIAIALVLGAVLIAATGCVARPLPDGWTFDTGAGQSETGTRGTASDGHEQTIALGNATDADVQLSMGAGELNVNSSDTSSLAEARFIYDNSSFEPEVSYSVSGSTGMLDISQSNVRFKFGSQNRNTWDVALGKGIPMKLTTHMGAGEADVDLRDLDVRELVMRLGAGATNVDLTGPRSEDVKGDIQAGVGQLTIRLPKDVGVKVSGRNEGVGAFEAEGFTVQGDAYVNDAYGTSPVTIDLTVVRGVGEVKLVLQ